MNGISISLIPSSFNNNKHLISHHNHNTKTNKKEKVIKEMWREKVNKTKEGRKKEQQTFNYHITVISYDTYVTILCILFFFSLIFNALSTCNVKFIGIVLSDYGGGLDGLDEFELEIFMLKLMAALCELVGMTW